MQFVNEYPHAVERHDLVRIPMRDGVHLCARLWLPNSAHDAPAPAILEYIPYRLRDGTVLRDAMHHHYFAGHGYASLRVDLRGSGESEGVLRDEYLEQELADGEDILAWIAQQPWCDGSVGMIGISWGGFNGLQLAERRPEPLKAVVSVCSTDDRYADDVHYMGGCLLGDNLSWASTMFALNSLPPDPEVVGERWREMWRERLEGSGLWLATWLDHPHRDAYWRHGSICENFAGVEAPVLAVSGWADGYSNAVPRLVEQLPGVCKGLIGPWSHKYPHLGQPGPAIGFLQECRRWWDQWLKGEACGIERDPALRVWMQESMPPAARYDQRPGRWVAEPTWPSENVTSWRLPLAPGRLCMDEESPSEQAAQSVQSPLSCGLYAGKWCSYVAGPDLPLDQRREDGGSLVFDSPPLDETLEILGQPRVELALSADRPVAQVAVRLCDVAPDGRSTRVTYGLLNLTHRDSHADPSPLEPGQSYRVSVKLNDVAQAFPVGHRIRLSLSSSYWPLAWPAPEPVQLTIRNRDSALVLPLRSPRPEDTELKPFAAPECAPPPTSTPLEPAIHRWDIRHELESDTTMLEVTDDSGALLLDETGMTTRTRTQERYSSRQQDFDSIRGETHWECGRSRGEWSIHTVTHTVLTANAQNFQLQASLEAFEGERQVYYRTWHRTIPRKLV
ncbi:CocE/NonD family hydrolase [Billgrantia bachuensis]|uniref:CocE/NonD family hydrolase n=1 Tax=Billgrantia bachuensis TaxID=2717286 RepID=A0ABX0PSA9_9GAMM|nr:CocE/NonD family hydrolase [Halomonas bachuensis]NIC06215.1 CocE/NonD family hydrolase [Halomonas bachuensis]